MEKFFAPEGFFGDLGPGDFFPFLAFSSAAPSGFGTGTIFPFNSNIFLK